MKLLFCWLLTCLSALGAQQIINVGSAANDGTGDTARTAFGKANANFTDLYGSYLAKTGGNATNITVDGLTLRNITRTNAIVLTDSTGKLVSSTMLSSYLNRFHQTCDDYSAIADTDTTIFTNAYCLSDGKQGGFTWYAGDTSTTNAGTILASTSGGVGRWKRDYSGFVNAKWFGAKGDNSTIDTAALQACIDFAASVDPVPVVYIPAGQYKIDDALVVSAQYASVVGDGILQTRIIQTSTTKDAIKLAARNLKLEEFEIAFPVINTAAGIHFDTATVGYVADNVVIRNVAIWGLGAGTGPAYGIDFNPTSGTPAADGTFYSSHNLIDHCQILGWKTYGIDMGRTNVTVNTTSIAGSTQVNGQSTFAADNATGIRLRQFQTIDLSGGLSIQNAARGIQIDAANSQFGLKIDGVYFEAFSEAAIQIVANNNQCSGGIRNCFFSQTSLASTTNACVKLDKFMGVLDLLSCRVSGTIDSTHKILIVISGPSTVVMDSSSVVTGDANYTFNDAVVWRYFQGKFGNDQATPGTFSIVGLANVTPLVLTTSSYDTPILTLAHKNATPTYSGVTITSLTNAPAGARNWFVGANVTEYGDISFRRGKLQGDSPINANGTNVFRLSAAGDALADGNMAVGTETVNASALLTLSSTTKGFLPPQMTKAQRNAISSPANGLVLYQTDNTPGLRVYENGAWVKYSATADP